MTALHRFRNFAELYASLPLLSCGYTEETIGKARPEDMEQYYSLEEQASCGVVGIEVRRLPAEGGAGEPDASAGPA